MDFNNTSFVFLKVLLCIYYFNALICGHKTKRRRTGPRSYAISQVLVFLRFWTVCELWTGLIK